MALAYGIGGALAAAGIVVSFLYTGSAMATTAIGTLIPILRDNGELKTRFGTYLLAAGGIGEFGPILLVTLVLSTDSALHESLILLAFIALALVLAVGSMRWAWRGWPLLERTFEASSQLAVRLTVVLVFGLVFLASKLGLDLLLGGFVAGMIVRLALQGHELQVFESKLTAVGFGFFVPFFFVVSGIEFDLAALGSVGAIAKLAMFFVLFLIVRGTPALLLYRGVLGGRDRAALAFYSRPSCRWSSRSRRWRPRPATCAPRPPPGWSARRCSRPWSSPSSAWRCGATRRPTASLHVERGPGRGLPSARRRAPRRAGGLGRRAPVRYLRTSFSVL